MDTTKDLAQFKKSVIVFKDGDIPAKGQRSTGKISTDKTLHGVYFKLTDASSVGLTESVIADEVDAVVLRAEGKVIREVTATQILDLYQHYKNDMGIHTVAGVIPVEFAESAFDLKQLNNQYAIGMQYKGKPMTLTYEIRYKSPATLTAVKCEVRAIVDERVQEFGLHKRIISHTRTFTGTGNVELTDLPLGDGKSSLLAYHIVLGSGVISEVTVKGDDVVYDQLPREMLELMLNDAGRKAQDGYFHVPFNLDNDPRSMQAIGPGTAYWLVKPYWSTTPGGSFTIIEERIHNGL